MTRATDRQMPAAIDSSSQITQGTRASDRAIAVWLLVCCAMIFAMVLIGGITRLTESGLSITQWKPIEGVLPPLSAAEWQSEFERYQQIPEYQEINRGMTLAEFKGIYWWEYVHRLWGRLIGAVFAVPLAVFLIRGQVRRSLLPHLIAMFVLGGLQGALGWYMVQSGLSERTDVSQYRLAAHFLAALAIYSYIFWVALTLLRPPSRAAAAAPLRAHLFLIAALLLLTLTFGAFVAGLNGGLVYNSFPLMGGQLVPGEAFDSAASLFEDPVTAQFVHRWLAVAVVAATAALWLRRGSAAAGARRPIDLFAIMALLQAGLGVATLLLVVPVPLAAAHQAGAVVLWTLALWSLHAAR
jgi:cytochrome c oxidase assembly protein subunit 15